jgi:HAE1 family hydrophobic/amphiphilic exporter-1
MSITDFFIRRSVTTTLLMAGILGFGLISYFDLPVSDLPPVEYPTIQVTANLPGANPDIMASAVATPLEKAFSNIAGVDSMSSTSTNATTTITLQFDFSRTIDAASLDVQSAISRATGELPRSMQSPPSFRKVNPASRPVLFLALTSETMTLAALNEYAEDMIGRRISMINGVAQINVFGAQKYAVRVEVDPDRMATRQVALEDIRAAFAQQNVNLPAGSMHGVTKAYTVQSNSQLTASDQFKPMIIAYRNGNPVRLEDVATVRDSVAFERSVFWVNGKSGMIVAVQKQPDANTVEVVDAVKRQLPSLRQNMPAGINLDVEFDASRNIRESIEDVKFTLYLTIGLVVLVIFVFLRNISATMIPAIAVPLSLLGTFACMKILGFSIDTLSMMAMTLSVGFVVDDAIVMLENIVRHMEMGKTRMQAAYEGAREIGFTIISMTISLVAVFIPVLFLDGIIGRLLREFSVTIAVAVLISGLISLSLTPLLCSRFLKHDHEHGKLFYIVEGFFTGMNNLYRNTLHFVLRHRFVTLVLTIALTIVTGWLFVIMPKSFVPTVDQGMVFGGTEAAQDTSFEEMIRLQKQVMGIVQKNQWVSQFGTGATGQNTGFLFIHFKHEKRPHATAIVADLQKQFAQIPGFNVFLQPPPLLTLGQNESRYQYSVALQDADTAALYQWAPKLEAKLRTLPILADVYSDLQLNNPRINVDIDRDRALALGVTPEQIANTLYDAYGNRRVSTISAPANEYDVVMEVLPQFRKDPAGLSKLYVRSKTDKLVPLSSVVRERQGVAPLSVNHIGQLPAVNLQFNAKAGVSLSEVTAQVDEAAKEIGLPDTMSFTYQGTASAFQKSVGGLAILLGIAILVIYLVLGVLYESFVHPITILSGLPSAGLGALITLLLFKDDLNLFSFVGIILLIGIVKKNAIMMVDFAILARNDGHSAEDAIFEGCMQRFRPIMMTTMCALLGTLPIAVGYGAGGEARRPLGLAVVGGLIVSQLLTLYITPVIYLYLEKLTPAHRDAKENAVPAAVPAIPQ